jgi:NADH dehydrogenase
MARPATAWPARRIGLRHTASGVANNPNNPHGFPLARCGAISDKTASEEFPMPARIYRPARNAMQSGTAKTQEWVLEHVADTAREVDPLMGWTSASDTQAQIKLRFPTKEAAVDYAREHGIDAVVSEPNLRKPNIRPGGYGDNFATNRRTVWTH